MSSALLLLALLFLGLFFPLLVGHSDSAIVQYDPAHVVPSRPLLTTREQATRLAKALATDIALYECYGLSVLSDQELLTALSAPIADRRSLFQQRVVAAFHEEYDKAIEGTLPAACRDNAVPEDTQQRPR